MNPFQVDEPLCPTLLDQHAQQNGGKDGQARLAFDAATHSAIIF
jgi:hypothetical protein